MKRIFHINHISMKANNRTLFLLAIIYKMTFFLFLLPTFNRSIRYVMKLWGQSYITLGNLASFLLYPPTILLFLITLIVILILIQYEVTSMFQFCYKDVIQKKPSLIRILLHGLVTTLRYVIKANVVIPFIALLIYVTANVPLLIVIIMRIRIPYILIIATSDEIFIKALLILFLLFITFIAFRCIFVLPFSILEKQSITNAMKNSCSLMKGRTLKTVCTFLIYNIITLLFFFVIYYTVVFITALFTFFFADKSMVIAVFLSIFPKINFYIGVFFSMISLVINLNLISSMYQEYRIEDHGDDLSKAILIEERKLHIASVRHKYILLFLLLLFVTFGCVNLYQTIRTDSFNLMHALPGIKITSHRGYSGTAPENTLPALEKAIEAMADYAEIDIQQTKDGVLVLLHDKGLRRTTGLNNYLWSLTYEEIYNLDAGIWFGIEFENTKIPTLEEVLEFCKGRIMLNIDIKIHGFEQNLAEELVYLIEKYEYQYQCVVSSTNNDILNQIKMLNSDIKTGYIMSAAYGNFYDKPYIDFFSINSKFINKNVVSSAHRAGKEIHAWTVNSSSEMERMKSLGVDNIITDRVTQAKEVLYSNDSTRSIIQLLNKMMSKRPTL